jgi:hypothetical protein
MKKRTRNIFLVIYLLVLLSNYGNISLLVISSIQSNAQIKEISYDGIEPRARLGEIATVAFDSVCSQKNNIQDAKYLSFYADKLGKLSSEEIAILLSNLQKYNKQVIYAPLSKLKLLGLYSPFGRDLNGAFLYWVDSIEEATNEKVVVKITCYQSFYYGQGYSCTLVFKDGIWQVDSIVCTWIV